jgi:hypothetical protein
MSNRGKNPSSHDALRRATEKRKKDAKQVHITLSPKAIASAKTAASSLGISRSELIERLLGKGEAWLVEAATSANDSIPTEG